MLSMGTQTQTGNKGVSGACVPCLCLCPHAEHVFVYTVCLCLHSVCVCACVWPKEDVDMKATGEHVLSNHKRKHEASPV